MNLKPIKIKDIIWGDIVIDEPVVIELISAKAIQRLKGIDCGCYAPLYNNPRNLDHNLLKYTRFDHSIGVYWLLEQYGDDLEAQVSGLLHDVSHTAFSHGADYFFDEGCQKSHSYQDDNHDSFIKNSAIPKILEKYDLTLDRIIHEANFPLLENELPDICADRIDYSLRSALHSRDYTRDEVTDILNHLKTKDNQWYFDNLDYGQKYANLFKKMNDTYYSDASAAILYTAMKGLMRYAIEKKYITKDDFLEDDEYVLNKIKAKMPFDNQLKRLYNNINNKQVFRQVEGNTEAEPIYLKSRIIDPYVLEDGKFIKLSGINNDWAKVVKEDLRPRKYYILVTN